jgi:predicted RNA-binding protein with PUA-like domain
MEFDGDAGWRASLLLSLGRRQGVVGIFEITKPYYPDPTDASGKFGMFDVRAVEALNKADPRLAEMALITISRLSVQKVSGMEMGYHSRTACDWVPRSP